MTEIKIPYKEGDKITMTLTELAECYDEVMFNGNSMANVINFPSEAKGFTIGRGRKLYWYLLFRPSGLCSCYAIELEGLSWPRNIWQHDYPVTVHF